MRCFGSRAMGAVSAAETLGVLGPAQRRAALPDEKFRIRPYKETRARGDSSRAHGCALVRMIDRSRESPLLPPCDERPVGPQCRTRGSSSLPGRFGVLARCSTRGSRIVDDAAQAGGMRHGFDAGASVRWPVVAVGHSVVSFRSRIIGRVPPASRQTAALSTLRQLTASRRFFPALNEGAVEAGMAMRSPVPGLRPSRAGRVSRRELPETGDGGRSSPRASASEMVENRAVTAESASVSGQRCGCGDVGRQFGSVHCFSSGSQSGRGLSSTDCGRGVRAEARHCGTGTAATPGAW